MTCIVGVKTGDECWMGADSAAADGWEVRAVKQPKLFWLDSGRFTIGYTTSFRMGQILQYHLQIPLQEEPQNAQNDFAYMVRVFVRAVRDCLRGHGFTKIENSQEEGGTFLVAYRGDIYEICSDFQVYQSADNLYAIGCGAGYALGAMYTLDPPPQERCKVGLKAAAHFSGAVIKPFVVLEC